MSVREVLLFACLVALGTWSLREQNARDHGRLARLLRRERRLVDEVRALRNQHHDFRREAHALHNDRYYVERIARAQLGWRPSPGRMPGTPPGDFPPLDVAPSVLVQGLPSPTPSSPAQVGVQPSGPPQPARGQQLLAWLGYSSVGHFQRKMMRGGRTGVLDAATVGRARELAGLLHSLGFRSVKVFQRRAGLSPDGIFGRRTEQRARELWRERRGARPPDLLATNGRAHGPGG